MSTPLKVSDGLYAVARQEAAAAQRSITGQVEYWAKIGRAVEAMLAPNELHALTRVGEALIPMFPSDTRRTEIHALLLDIASQAARESVKEKLQVTTGPIYATDSNHPGMVIQVMPDGTRIPGHLQSRKFVPGPKPAISRK